MSTSRFAVSTICRPPSILTAAAPPSWINRPALRIASSMLSWIGQERHVRDDQRPLGAAADGARMVDHHVERDGKGVVVAEHNHAERIADQNHIDAGAIQQARHREIVRGPDGDLFAAFFHGPKIGNSYGFHRLELPATLRKR